VTAGARDAPTQHIEGDPVLRARDVSRDAGNAVRTPHRARIVHSKGAKPSQGERISRARSLRRAAEVIQGKALRLAVLAALATVGCDSPQQGQGNALFRGASAMVRRLSNAPAASSPGSFFSEGFDDPCFECRGWYDNTDAPVTTGEKATGTGAAEFRFVPGAAKPIRGDAMRHAFPASSTVYVSYRVKYSNGWVGSRKPYHPHEFMVLSTMDDAYAGPSYARLALYVEQNYDGGGHPRLAIQDSKSISTRFGALPVNLTGLEEDRSVGSCNAPVEPGLVGECYNAPPWSNNKQLRGPAVFSANPGPGYISDWNQVEAYFQLNTIKDGAALADGVMQYWFNGKLILDRHDILFRTPVRAQLKLNQFIIAPYIGDGSPVAQTMYVDDLIVAPKRPETR
jgi:hypothetical protein